MEEITKLKVTEAEASYLFKVRVGQVPHLVQVLDTDGDGCIDGERELVMTIREGEGEGAVGRIGEV